MKSLINLKIEDINFHEKTIFLRTVKNRRQQIIPLSNKLSYVLQDYLLIRKGEPSDYLFCSRHGTKLTKSGVESIISKYNRSRGVTKTSIHVFRHTYAKMYLLNGGDSLFLKELLGHSTLSMTNEYVALFTNDLSKNYDKLNPLDSMEIGDSKQTIKMR